jgi:hypothetical protein
LKAEPIPNTPNPNNPSIDEGSGIEGEERAITETLSKAAPASELPKPVNSRVVVVLLAVKSQDFDSHPIFQLLFPVISKEKSAELPPALTLISLIAEPPKGALLVSVWKRGLY